MRATRMIDAKIMAIVDGFRGVSEEITAAEPVLDLPIR